MLLQATHLDFTGLLVLVRARAGACAGSRVHLQGPDGGQTHRKDAWRGSVTAQRPSRPRPRAAANLRSVSVTSGKEVT